MKKSESLCSMEETTSGTGNDPAPAECKEDQVETVPQKLTDVRKAQSRRHPWRVPPKKGQVWTQH